MLAGDDVLQPYLSLELRNRFEQDYYAKVAPQATLSAALKDPDLHLYGESHVLFLPDHGVVHVRDVARRVLEVLDVLHGVLIPMRSEARLNGFMKGYGVVLAYLHDIGMSNFTAVGRAVHPEFAAQEVFSPHFDDMIDRLASENSGNISARLQSLYEAGKVATPPPVLLRELLALAVCHSKSKVPSELLEQPAQLRIHVLELLTTSLASLYNRRLSQRGATTRFLPEDQAQADNARLRANLTRFYGGDTRDAYAWLLTDDAALRELADDVFDTVRALRCADALRQRGTVFQTSASYEIFVDSMTANAIYGFRLGTDQLYFASISDPLHAGEANIAASEITPDGSLRIAFHRGAFVDELTVERAAYITAIAVDDIQLDVVGSLASNIGAVGLTLKDCTQIEILLETTPDNLTFAERVAARLKQRNPSLADRISVVPSLQNTSAAEQARYQHGRAITDENAQQDLLAQIARSGHNVASMNAQRAFEHVRLIRIQASDTLIEAGTPASFVYIPLGPGLCVIPLGGYEQFSVSAWMPLGSTGVIRGSTRSATVTANREVDALMIPGEIYLRYWHAPYTVEALFDKLKSLPE